MTTGFPRRNKIKRVSPDQIVVGRFAPSPTGPLHLGSLVAAVGSYCLAKQAGGHWLLRMEDLDTHRVVPGAADDILRTLDFLGLHWDGKIIWQSQRLDAYRQAISQLKEKKLVYECACSRKEILQSAPHPGEEGPIYPGTCRKGISSARTPRSLRIKVAHEQICFTDGVFGSVEQKLASAVGDFVLFRADGMFAYQLAVVVDDAASQVNQVVRGADLLSSTARQIYLHTCLGTNIPNYIHLPLVVDAYGNKVSKRDGVVSQERVTDATSLIARTIRLLGQEVPENWQEMTAPELLQWGVENFDSRAIPTADQRLAGT